MSEHSRRGQADLPAHDVQADHRRCAGRAVRTRSNPVRTADVQTTPPTSTDARRPASSERHRTSPGRARISSGGGRITGTGSSARPDQPRPSSSLAPRRCAAAQPPIAAPGGQELGGVENPLQRRGLAVGGRRPVHATREGGRQRGPASWPRADAEGSGVAGSTTAGRAPRREHHRPTVGQATARSGRPDAGPVDGGSCAPVPLVDSASSATFGAYAPTRRKVSASDVRKWGRRGLEGPR